jgi:hypothetical protein
MEGKVRIDKRVVQAFQTWQKLLLDRYLDLLSKKMRDTKKSVLIQRLKIIKKKLQERIRYVLKRWQARARVKSIKSFNR